MVKIGIEMKIGQTEVEQAKNILIHTLPHVERTFHTHLHPRVRTHVLVLPHGTLELVSY